MNKILLVGTVSNVSKTLSKEVRVVSRALSDLELVGIFLVESDSKDLTLEILSKLSNEISGFDFLSSVIYEIQSPIGLQEFGFVEINMLSTLEIYMNLSTSIMWLLLIWMV